MLTIVQPETPQQIATARELMVEYAQTLGFQLCFQNFDDEMRALPTHGGRAMTFLSNGRMSFHGAPVLRD